MRDKGQHLAFRIRAMYEAKNILASCITMIVSILNNYRFEYIRSIQ